MLEMLYAMARAYLIIMNKHKSFISGLFCKKLFVNNINPNIKFEKKHSGGLGFIECKYYENNVVIEYEYSGSPRYSILLAPMKLDFWENPKNLKIPQEIKLEILINLRKWFKSHNIKSDIDLPDIIEYQDEKCMHIDCKELKIKDSNYCLTHYNLNLIR